MVERESCSRCPEPSVRMLGTEAFCTECAEAFLAPIRERVADLDRERDPFAGHGRQDGPLRPDYGPGWADVRCDRCSATWVGKIGDSCGWCERSLALLLDMQREVLLHPDLPDPDDTRRKEAEGAWAERLGRAVAAGLLEKPIAENALLRELAKSAKQ